MLLKVRNLTKMYGSTTILDDISLVINAGERVGLVGANGVGKSTLLKIILGELEADAGVVTFAPNSEYGYLAQQLETLPGQTIEAVLWDSQRQLRQIQARLDELTTLMHTVQGDVLTAALAEYGALAERFEHYGGYEIDHTIDYVLAGLNLSHLPRDRNVDQISGGEKTRLGLAALLISAPDLLLLDEPTNHLDFQAVNWLESYLCKQPGAVLTISHDREFLNRIATSIIEIDEYTHKAKAYTGNYAAFLAEKQLERWRWEDEYQRQQAEISDLQQRMKPQNHRIGHNRPASDGDKIAYKAAGERVASSIARNVRAAELALKRILDDPIPEPPQPLVFKPAFQPLKSESARPLIVEGVSHWYDERQILNQISFDVYPHSRILLLGSNGAGKTTLLNLLAGLVQPQRGRVKTAAGISIGYLRQENQRDHSQQTIFEAYREGMIGFPSDIMNELLSWGLFTYEETTRRIGDVSMGQYHKLQIAKLLASKANLLILDEPTNHVSFEVLEQFETALNIFPGPVIVVSHDRWLLEHFTGEVWLLDNGRLVDDRDKIVFLMAAIEIG